MNSSVSNYQNCIWANSTCSRLDKTVCKRRRAKITRVETLCTVLQTTFLVDTWNHRDWVLSLSLKNVDKIIICMSKNIKHWIETFLQTSWWQFRTKCCLWNLTDLADVLIPLIESPQKEETTVAPSSPPKDSSNGPSPPSPDVQYDIDPTDLALASIPGNFSQFG